jgi:hypothetical protein
MRLLEPRPLGLTLGAIYLLLGTIELYTHRDGAGLELLFWGGSLVGGGVLVLIGTQVRTHHRAAGLTVLTLGAVLGINATMWTLLLPVFAVLVLVRFYRVEDAGLMVFVSPTVPESLD